MPNLSCKEASNSQYPCQCQDRTFGQSALVSYCTGCFCCLAFRCMAGSETSLTCSPFPGASKAKARMQAPPSPPLCCNATVAGDSLEDRNFKQAPARKEQDLDGTDSCTKLDLKRQLHWSNKPTEVKEACQSTRTRS